MDKRQEPACHIPDSPPMRAVGLFIRLMRRHHACVERRIGSLGIHHSQHRVLVHLARRGGEPPSQKELAERLGVSPAAVTTLLQRLEKEGYISRAITDEDNRRHEIRITERGLAKVLEGREIFESIDHAMFEGFSEEEMATLISFMERIDQNLDAAGAPADPCCRTEGEESPSERKEV